MKPIDYVIIAAVAAIVVGVVAYLIYSKKKGKNVGCGCGCNGCSNASACGIKNKRSEQQNTEEEQSEEV